MENPAELPADERKTIEFVGDSITEGVLIDVDFYDKDSDFISSQDQNNRCYQDDVCATYAWQTAEALNLRPIFMGYGVYLSAAVFLTLAHYDAAGFYHGQRHTRRFLFCTLTGTFLALASFADGLSLFQMAMAAACVLPLLGQTYALLSPETES